MRRAAAAAALALAATGCGESRTAADVKRDFARHGIRLEAPRELEAPYRRYLHRQEHRWQTKLQRLAILGPPPDRIDEYVLFTPVPGDRSEDASLNVVVAPDAAQALADLDLTDTQDFERRGYTFVRNRNVIAAFKRRISARMRARIEAALRGE